VSAASHSPGGRGERREPLAPGRLRLSEAGRAHVRRGKVTLVEKLSRPAKTLHSTPRVT